MIEEISSQTYVFGTFAKNTPLKKKNSEGFFNRGGALFINSMKRLFLMIEILHGLVCQNPVNHGILTTVYMK